MEHLLLVSYNHQYLRSIQYRKQRAFEKEHQILSRLYHPIFRTIVGSDLFAVEALINRAKKRMPMVIKKEALIILLFSGSIYERGDSRLFIPRTMMKRAPIPWSVVFMIPLY